MYVHNIYHRFEPRNVTMKITNKELIDFIKKEKVVTSSDVAKFFSLSWNTAEKYLMELLLENKIRRIKKERVTLWTL
jgi:predicted HTH transcriptional regulator